MKFYHINYYFIYILESCENQNKYLKFNNISTLCILQIKTIANNYK